MTDLQVVDSIEDIAYQLKELDNLIFILIENYLDKIDYDYTDKLQSYETCRN